MSSQAEAWCQLIRVVLYSQKLDFSTIFSVEYRYGALLDYMVTSASLLPLKYVLKKKVGSDVRHWCVVRTMFHGVMQIC